jgi:hypothetical protein
MESPSTPRSNEFKMDSRFVAFSSRETAMLKVIEMLEQENVELKKQLDEALKTSAIRSNLINTKTVEISELNTKLEQIVTKLALIRDRDFELLDKVCEIANLHDFAWLKQDIEAAITAAKGN